MVWRPDPQCSRGRRSSQHHVVGVAVQPNVVGHHADGVNLTVNERDTVSDRAMTEVSSQGLMTAACANPSTFVVAPSVTVVALLHEEGVKGAVVGFAGVPRHDQPTTFVSGTSATAVPMTGSVIVVVEFTGRHHGPHDRYVGEVLLARFIDLANPIHTGTPGVCLMTDWFPSLGA